MLLIDLEELITRKVAGRLELLNGQLEEAIRRAVDVELDRLIDLATANGEIDASLEKALPPAATKTCSRCKRALDVSRFEKHRAVCKDCRKSSARRREAEQEPSATPFAASASPSSPGIEAPPFTASAG